MKKREWLNMLSEVTNYGDKLGYSDTLNCPTAAILAVEA